MNVYNKTRLSGIPMSPKIHAGKSISSHKFFIVLVSVQKEAEGSNRSENRKSLKLPQVLKKSMVTNLTTSVETRKIQCMSRTTQRCAERSEELEQFNCNELPKLTRQDTYLPGQGTTSRRHY